MKKGFSLVELLVVIAIIALLMAVLYPSLSRARLQAKVLTVNYELGQIGLALNAYEMSNKNWPPTRADCSEIGQMCSLPSELVSGGYINKGGRKGRILFSNIEDKFYPGHSYRYIAPGPFKDYYNSASANLKLYIPKNFPANDTSKITELSEHKERRNSPVKWALFSLGPNYNIQDMEKEIRNGRWTGFPTIEGFPFMKDTWYNKQTKSGILTRIKTSKDQFVGSFQQR